MYAPQQPSALETDEKKEMYTLNDFLSEHKLMSLESSFKKLGITVDQLRFMHIDDIDDLCSELKLKNDYARLEILLRTGINQLQNTNGDDDKFIARSSVARSTSHIVKEKKSKTQSQNTKDYDALIKLVMIGDASVGKSNLVVRFCDDKFEEAYISTIGVDFKFRAITYNNTLIKLQVWDTAGQERFRAITSAYYRSGDGIILCYDVCNRSSFESLTNWIAEIRKHTQNFVMLVGCKKDIADTSPHKRKVSISEAQTFAELHKLQFIEVSAKSTENVDTLFFNATDSIMHAINSNKQSAGDASSNNITIDSKQFKKRKKKCGCK